MKITLLHLSFKEASIGNIRKMISVIELKVGATTTVKKEN